MDRLTTSGTGTQYIKKYPGKYLAGKVVGKHEKAVSAWEMSLEDIQTVLNRLAAYENTGLTPAEVRDLNLVNKNRVFTVDKENEAELKKIVEMGLFKGPDGEIKPLEAFFQYELPVFLDEGALEPIRAHKTDAGLDLYSRENVTIPGYGGSATFDTGVHIKLPPNTYGKIESKSGLNVNFGIVSCGGVIDEGYTGSIKVKLYNLGPHSYSVVPGMKIAQLIVQPCEYVTVKQLPYWNNDTERGDQGFGSTGR